jgi:hypothetical protein
MRRRPYTDLDPVPHGTRELIRYFVQDLPDTRRHYGRALIRELAERCVICHHVDLDQTRRSRMRAAYHRRRR